MKNILKTTLAIAAIALFASSCTSSKKQKCDAYGSIASIENTSNDLVISNNSEEKI